MEKDITSGLPLISVIVPIYNGEHYLNDFFKHYEDQTYPNLEFWERMRETIEGFL